MVELLIAVVLLIVCVFLIKTVVHNMTCPADKFKFHFKVFFIGGNVNHNNITKLSKGECAFKVENGVFDFTQGDNVIQDNIADIYNIRSWVYEGYTYIAIRMKTHSEYTFSLLVDEASAQNLALVNSIKEGMLKSFKTLAQKLNVEFVDCGESQPDHEQDDSDDDLDEDSDEAQAE